MSLVPLGPGAIEVIVGLASFGVAFALYRAIFPESSMSGRVSAHLEQRLERGTPRSRAARRQKSVGIVRALLERLKLTRGEEVRKSTELLVQAGWRAPDALTIFLGLRLALPVGHGVLAFVLAPGVSHHMSPLTRMCGGFAGVVPGAYAPSIMVKNTIQNRRRKIQMGLSDALDLFVICAEAGLGLGLGLEPAITRVAREIGASARELADELGLTAIELDFLPNRGDALANLTRRVDTASIRGLVTTLTQTERYGTPLAQSLRVLAGEFRNMRMMQAEEKAARLPATLTVPMIIFVMPPLFAVLIGPAIIQIMASLHHH
jgi:tight adherence protein C